MKIIKGLFVTGILSVLLLSSCTGKESSEEKIKITIEREDKGVEEQQKESRQPQETPILPQKELKTTTKTTSLPTKKPEATTKVTKSYEPVVEAPPKQQEPSEPAVETRPKQLIEMDMDFKTVANNLSLERHSKYEIKDYWQKVEGKSVIWIGKVYEINKGRRGFKILVDNPGLKSRKGYNIILIGSDQKDIESISKGAHIRFKGILRKFDYGQAGYSAIIVLSDVKIL